MRLALSVVFVCFASAGSGDIAVPQRTIRARELISAQDIVVKPGKAVGAVSDPANVVGFEARVTLYAGRPIRPGDVSRPAIVDRNQLVTLVFERNGLRITAEGRSLGRGAAGQMIRVMNLASRVSVTGRVRSDGTIGVEK